MVFRATASETAALLDVWKVIIGLVFVLAVLFLPRGIAGLGSGIGDWLFAAVSRRRNRGTLPAGAAQPAE